MTKSESQKTIWASPTTRMKATRSLSPLLAIETSCDDTSVAINDGAGCLLTCITENQDAIHSPFGGVIPELACRNHTKRILPLVKRALTEAKLQWRDIAGLGVTYKPGLIGSLLVGVTVAKTLALIHELPLVGVDHLTAHLHAGFIKTAAWASPSDFDYPYVGLCVSGGHTALYEVKAVDDRRLLGRTRDDAAGEAFDKFGKLLDLGYPAGRIVDERARRGQNDAYKLPRAWLDSRSLDFSFSGLKTAGVTLLKGLPRPLADAQIDDLCASFQQAIIDVLVQKLRRAWRQTGLRRAVITGGVSANSALRRQAQAVADADGVRLVIPPLTFCTDNAAMVAVVGQRLLARGKQSSLSLRPEAS